MEYNKLKEERMSRICLTALVASIFGAATAQPQYEVVDLTKIFGEEFSARAINNQGVVAGSMRLNHFQSQACVIENGKLTMLPRYKGKHPWYAIDINDKGEVLGAGDLNGTLHTFLYRNGKVIDTDLPGTESNSAGAALNNDGRITGTISIGIPRAFVWEDGVTTILQGLSAGSSGAAGLNDKGVVTGTSQVAGSGSPHHASKWINGKISDIHPAWAEFSSGVAVNSRGEIAGWGWAIPGGQQGVLWRDGKAIQLGNFGGGQSRAYDINDLSQIVGFASAAGQPNEAFLWEFGTMYRLEDLVLGGSGFQLIEFAEAINNEGQILSSGFTGAAGHELLLNPVPEPSCALGVFGGLLILTISRRRKSRRG